MNLLRCSREAELKEQMASGHWPQASNAELRAHVAACSGCQDAVLLHQSFRAARAVSVSQAQLPPPGLLWWRAQLRRRNAALARVQRPVVGAQIFALAITGLIAVGIAIVQAKPGLLWMKGICNSLAENLPSLWTSSSLWSSGNLTYLLPGVGMLVLVGAVAAYVSLEKQ